MLQLLFNVVQRNFPSKVNTFDIFCPKVKFNKVFYILLGIVLKQIQLGLPQHPGASSTRIPLNRMKSPSTLDIVLSNGLFELDKESRNGRKFHHS
jgi:hypothetical protein